MSNPIAVVALDGKVCLSFNEPPRDTSGLADFTFALTIEQADALWNAIAEAELVALEQRVRARRRVTEGARGGWVGPAQGRHAAETAVGGICLATDGKFYCTLAEGHAGPHEARDTDERICATWPRAVDAGMALAESTAAALDVLAAEGVVRAAQPEPGHQLLAEYGTDDYYRQRAGVVDAGMALAESTTAALDRLAPEGGWRQLADRRAAPEPGDPFYAPDYQHPDDDEAGQ